MESISKYSLTDQLQELSKKDFHQVKDINKCKNCDITLEIANDDIYMCPKCDAVKDFTQYGTSCNVDTEYQNYSSINNSFVSMKPQGYGSANLKSTLFIHLSNYKAMSSKKNYKKIEQFNYINTDFNLSKEVITLAASWINSITKIHRDDVRKGLFAAAVYFAAIENGIIKDIESYASMFKVSLKYVNEGIDLLRRYHSEGLIVIPINKISIDNQALQYCKRAKVPYKYHKFVNDVIERIDHKRVDELKNKFNVTKCIGVIYTLSKVITDYAISDEELSKIASNLTPNTFKRVYKIIEDNKKIFRKPFFRNNIPYPPKWDPDSE